MQLAESVKVSLTSLQDCVDGTVWARLGRYKVQLSAVSPPVVILDTFYYLMQETGIHCEYHLRLGGEVIAVRPLIDDGCISVELYNQETIRKKVLLCN